MRVGFSPSKSELPIHRCRINVLRSEADSELRPGHWSARGHHFERWPPGSPPPVADETHLWLQDPPECCSTQQSRVCTFDDRTQPAAEVARWGSLRSGRSRSC